MRAQLSIQKLLLLLVSLAIVGSFFVFFTRAINSSLSSSEDQIIYPEQPPQILATRCGQSGGYIFLEADSLEGTVKLNIKNFNGTIANDTLLTLNFTDRENVSFKAPLDLYDSYVVRLYTPKWETSDTCTAKP